MLIRRGPGVFLTTPRQDVKYTYADQEHTKGAIYHNMMTTASHPEKRRKAVSHLIPVTSSCFLSSGHPWAFSGTWGWEKIAASLKQRTTTTENYCQCLQSVQSWVITQMI